MTNIGDSRNKDRISLWERVVLVLGKGGKKSEFLTRVEDIRRDSYILELPIRQSGDLHLEIGDNVEVNYCRKDAAYSFKASILDLFEGESNSIKIARQSDTQRIQRRRFVRLDISGKMTYRIIKSDDSQPVGPGLEMHGNLLNISAGGVLFESSSKIAEGDILVLTFSLKARHTLNNILAVVKRSERSSSKSFLVGAELVTRQSYHNYNLDKLENFLPQGSGTFDDNLQKLVVQFIYEQQVELKKKEMLKV